MMTAESVLLKRPVLRFTLILIYRNIFKICSLSQAISITVLVDHTSSLTFLGICCYLAVENRSKFPSFLVTAFRGEEELLAVCDVVMKKLQK